jgi:hypothetical protein
LGFINTREAHGGDDMAAQAATKAYPAELKAILERANAGDEAALPQLKKAFDQHPELVPHFGDMVEHAKQALLTLAAGKCLTAKEAIGRQMNELRDRLAATATSELERLLIDRICLSWLQVYHADIDLAQQLLANPGASPAGQAAEKRLDGAQRRFITATKALATLQRLARPSPSPVDFLSRPVAEAGAHTPAKPAPEAPPSGVSVCPHSPTSPASLIENLTRPPASDIGLRIVYAARTAGSARPAAGRQGTPGRPGPACRPCRSEALRDSRGCPQGVPQLGNYPVPQGRGVSGINRGPRPDPPAQVFFPRRPR